MNRGFHLGSIGGIEIVLDWSLLIIFSLVVFSLAAGLLPAWHPDWSVGMIWLVALVAAVLFLASILVHELSHALVGRALGIDVRRITLFVFGGMAMVERDPHTWRAEFWMAVVGPVTSLAIGIACLAAGTAMAENVGFDPDDPLGSLATLGPLATIVLWLGPLNIMLAIFNLVPGFPLDGGRVLRALLWGLTGDIYRATRWASALGRAFGLLLLTFGIGMFLGLRVPFFGAGVLNGLWLMLIGWFLHNAALFSYRQLLVQRSLEGVPVSRLMVADVATVDPDLPVTTLIDDYLIAHEQGSFPVVRQGRLLGLVGFEQVRKLPAEARPGKRVADIMIPADDLAVVAPDVAVAEAIGKIAAPAMDPLPVVADGHVRGLLRHEDILKWLALRGG